VTGWLVLDGAEVAGPVQSQPANGLDGVIELRHDKLHTLCSHDCDLWYELHVALEGGPDVVGMWTATAWVEHDEDTPDWCQVDITEEE